MFRASCFVKTSGLPFFNDIFYEFVLSKQLIPGRVLFTYWGRRGALSRFAFEVGREALLNPDANAAISVSVNNENFEMIRQIEGEMLPLQLFSTNYGPITHAWRIPIIRRRLVSWVERMGVDTIVELMPHVWSSFIMPAVKKIGVRYATVVHDAVAHPGDFTGLAKGLLDRAIDSADVVLTLSGAVAGRIEAQGRIDPSKIFTLFHPDLHYGGQATRRKRVLGAPLKLLFLGRILHYKGLPILIDAVEQLSQSGVAVELGVFGEGTLGRNAQRLKSLGAQVVNRWLTEDEIANALAHYDAMVLPHIEASQSGVAATAFGSGMPVICTPVGGLPEQVLDGITGLVARRADGPALAEAISWLARDPQLYGAMSSAIVNTQDQRSIARFVQDSTSHARYASPEFLNKS